MPPKKRPCAEEFDLEYNEQKVRKEQQQQEIVEKERRKTRRQIELLREADSLGSGSTVEELLAFELLKVGSLEKVLLAVQIVRDVIHLGPTALSLACGAVCEDESERKALLSSCHRIASVKEETLAAFAPDSTIILAPR